MSLDTAAAVTKLRSLTVRFDNGVQAATPIYPELCTVVQSEGADEEYGWLGSMPGMREWLGDRIFNKLRAAKFTLANREWESSLEIERNDIEDGRLLKYGPILEELGKEAAHHPDELLFEVIMAAEAQVCWDGQYFIDNDHVWGDSGSQSNDLTYNASDHTAVTEDEFRAAYHAARAAMLGFKNDRGKYLIRPRINPLPQLLLIVPPALEEVANKAINKLLVSDGETNIVLSKPQILTTNYFTSTVKFDLVNLEGPLKPFVFQARRALQRQMKGMDDREFKAVKFMTDARYNLGFLAWWKFVRTTFN